jgi:hypothetical protein
MKIKTTKTIIDLIEGKCVSMKNVKPKDRIINENVYYPTPRTMKGIREAIQTDPQFVEFGINEYTTFIFFKSKAKEEPSTINYNPRDQPQRDTDKLSAMNKYMLSEVNTESKTIGDALKNKNNLPYECWWNCFYQTYSNTLLNPNRSKRYLKTKEDFLEILGKPKILLRTE